MFCKNIRNREKEVNQDVERYTKDDILLSSADKFFTFLVERSHTAGLVHDDSAALQHKET